MYRVTTRFMVGGKTQGPREPINQDETIQDKHSMRPHSITNIKFKKHTFLLLRRFIAKILRFQLQGSGTMLMATAPPFCQLNYIHLNS